MNQEPKINGKSVTTEQFNRVLLLQEKKRRIQAEAKLLIVEEKEVDAELDSIVTSIEQAHAAGEVPQGTGETKEGAA